MTRSAAVVPIFALCLVAGCGPHYRLGPAFGELRHPAVRWVYRSQEHVVLWSQPMTGYLPALRAWHNEIRALEPIEDGVAVFEFDFGSRLSERASHIVFRSAESGKRLRGSAAETSPNLSPHTLRKLPFATSLGDRKNPGPTSCVQVNHPPKTRREPLATQG